MNNSLFEFFFFFFFINGIKITLLLKVFWSANTKNAVKTANASEGEDHNFLSDNQFKP